MLFGMDSVAIVYAYLAAPHFAQDNRNAGGGALILVSAQAAAAIRGLCDPHTGLLAQEAREHLLRIDDREGSSLS
jgi:hypothetical protein